MSVVDNKLLLAGDDAYVIENSVRLRSSASAYFSRTPASSGNRQVMTFSFWMKRGLLTYASNYINLFTSYPGSSAIDFIGFSPSSDSLRVWFNGSSSADLITTQVFRDPSAWYHVVVAIDTTQATASNRIKVYVNGSQVTSFSTSTYPAQNYNTYWNSSSYASAIGTSLNGPQGYFDGYLTEVNFIDGQALDPTSFGEYNEDTGVWQPVKYTGTYGTNGFYLNFSDNTTTTTLGYDGSGNGNNWTANNISLTSGATYDSMTDVPTLTGADAGNFAVLNPLDKNWWLPAVTTQATISKANLNASCGAVDAKVGSTMSVLGGKYYAEVTINSQTVTNIIVSGYAPTTFEIAYINDGKKSLNRSQSAYGATYTGGDLIGVAVDAPNNQVTFYKNGVSQGVITNTFIGDAIFIGAYLYNCDLDFNFGQRPFAYTPPTGFKSLHTGNLPDSDIVNGREYFNAVLYTGNGYPTSGTQSITGVNFQPDFLWIKDRSAALNHFLQDSIRGSTKVLRSNTTGAENTESTAVTSFDSGGFSLGANNEVNSQNHAYVSWNWKANGAGVSNTDGSITSTVSANPTAGFSVVTYTGTGSAATVGHGLGSAPKMYVVKARSFADDWLVYHASLGATKFIKLNTTGAVTTSALPWNNTAPTSSVFSLGTSSGVNNNTSTFVAYCFAEVESYSKFGSYTGNGSADGPFVYTGFRPAFIMWKRTDSSTGGEWVIQDTTRREFNPVDVSLYPNLSNAEATGETFRVQDTLSNGFKIRASAAQCNASGGTYIYAAFAENPFKNSLAR